MRAIALMVLLVTVGCGASAKRQAASDATTRAGEAPITSTDPCATRLHDLCGPLLLYYATHQRLPGKPEELLAVPGFEIDKQLVCPVSHKPYIYNRAGIATPGSGGRVILFDATPAHQGHRWAIAIQETTDDQPLVAKVIALPEAFFSR